MINSRKEITEIIDLARNISHNSDFNSTIVSLMQRLVHGISDLTQDSIGAAIDELATSPNLSREQKLIALGSIQEKLDEHLSALTKRAPDEAPVLWQNRARLDQKPVEFIRETYAEYIGKGFSRADIRRLDKRLYQALGDWLRHNELPADLDLPTKSELKSWMLENVLPELKKDHRVRDFKNLSDIARIRATRKKWRVGNCKP